VSGSATARTVEELLRRHGRTYASEAGIRLQRNTPAPLFQLLCLSLLLSARIRADVAVHASRALREAGWTTPDAMADSTWAQRTKVLNRSGYARYDESTSRMLAQTVDLLRDRYGGDLRRLRDDADRAPDAERRLLQEFTGIGAVGASIFCREVQLVWDEQYPYADDRALDTAQQLGLGREVSDLADLVGGRDEFTTLVAALVRCGLAGDADDVAAV
jgi:endonuclease III